MRAVINLVKIIFWGQNVEDYECTCIYTILICVYRMATAQLLTHGQPNVYVHLIWKVFVIWLLYYPVHFWFIVSHGFDLQILTLNSFFYVGKQRDAKSYFSEFFNLLLSSSLQAGTITLKSTVGSSSILGNSRFFKIFGSRYVFSCLCRFITGNGVVKDFCIITSCNDVVSTKNVGHYL